MIKVVISLIMTTALTVMAEIPLTKNGIPCAEIILNKTSPDPVRYAADELSRWVKAISGTEIPVLDSPGTAEYKIFFQLQPSGFTEDFEKLKGNDGYAVRNRGKELYIIASSPKGILNGVYKLLFKNTDIIWARPNIEFGTIFTPNPSLTLPQIDYIDIPLYSLRGWQFTCEWGKPDLPSEEWGVRQGNNWNALFLEHPCKKKFGSVMEYGGGHNIIGIYIQPDKYFAQHPDFYPLKNGKRVCPDKYPFPQLCFTNENLVTAFNGELEDKIQNNPEWQSYRILTEDTEILCECENCLRPIQLADGQTINPQEKDFRSTQFFLWLNRIARHIHAKYPDKRIITYAYLFTETPPRCAVESNIDILFCPIYQDLKHDMNSPENASTKERLLSWLKITPNITLRGYLGLVPGFPRPTDTVAMSDWRFCGELGIRKTYSEMFSDACSLYGDGVASWDANAMSFWVMANAPWNPMLTVNEMRMEFLNRVFGTAAAKDVSEYYRIIEEQWSKGPGSSNFQDSPVTNWIRCLTSDDIIMACRSALESAMPKVTKPNGKKMLGRIQSNFENGVKSAQSSQVSALQVQTPPSFVPAFDNGDWPQASVQEQFYVQYYSNRTGKLYSNKTALRMLYDSDNLYIGIRCFHAQSEKMYFRPADTEKKNLYPDGEGFEVFLGGHFIGFPKYVQIAFDPAKNCYTGGKPAKYSLETSINQDGWSAMLTVPWHDLGINPKQEKSFFGLFIRPYERNIDGKPSGYMAYLISGKRHDPNTFIEVLLKK